MRWSDDRFQTLKGLIDQGLSARQIGNELGVSRNAVIGKVHRGGLALSRAQGPEKKPEKKMPRQRKGRTRRYPAAAPDPRARPPSLPAPPPESFASPVTFEELREIHCRWPVNHMIYCGADRLAGSPYCARHSWIAHHGSAA
jgi:GcrA cell cycle regulator